MFHTDIIRTIYSFLAVSALSNAVQVSKQWYNVLKYSDPMTFPGGLPLLVFWRAHWKVTPLAPPQAHPDHTISQFMFLDADTLVLTQRPTGVYECVVLFSATVNSQTKIFRTDGTECDEEKPKWSLTEQPLQFQPWLMNPLRCLSTPSRRVKAQSGVSPFSRRQTGTPALFVDNQSQRWELLHPNPSRAGRVVFELDKQDEYIIICNSRHCLTSIYDDAPPIVFHVKERTTKRLLHTWEFAHYNKHAQLIACPTLLNEKWCIIAKKPSVMESTVTVHCYSFTHNIFFDKALSEPRVAGYTPIFLHSEYGNPNSLIIGFLPDDSMEGGWSTLIIMQVRLEVNQSNKLRLRPGKVSSQQLPPLESGLPLCRFPKSDCVIFEVAGTHQLVLVDLLKPQHWKNSVAPSEIYGARSGSKTEMLEEEDKILRTRCCFTTLTRTITSTHAPDISNKGVLSMVTDLDREDPLMLEAVFDETSVPATI